MKNCFVAFLLLLVLVSCKNEATQQHSNSYPDIVVGTKKNGGYAIENAAIIKAEWQKAIDAGGEHKRITYLQIVKAKTQGDVQQDFYMLVVKADSAKTQMAALLTEKGDEFYLDLKKPVSIICTGNCDGGCLPVGEAHNGTIRLACSTCADCIKTDMPLVLPE